MQKVRDLTGMKFGKLTAIEISGCAKDKKKIWKCVCECGNLHNVRGVDLTSGKTTSCGCKSKENYKNILGQKFGRLTVVRLIDNNEIKRKDDRKYWEAKCDCGNIKIISSQSLLGGYTTSCGCYKIEQNIINGKKKLKHKDNEVVHSRLYRIWSGMKNRCKNKDLERYKNYSGRGVKICKEWEEDSSCFIEWALSNGYKDNLTIDRINNDGNYEPLNCKWSTPKEQSRNTRTNLLVEYNGKLISIAEAAEAANINYGTLITRYRREGCTSLNLFRPVQHKYKSGQRIYVEYQGENISLAELSKITGIKRDTLEHRYKRGYRGGELIRPLGQKGSLSERELIQYKDKKITLKELSNLTGISYTTILTRHLKNQPLIKSTELKNQSSIQI